MGFPKRGEIYLVNLDPTIGSEIKKTRPVVIIQNDVGNQFSPLTIIAPITSGQVSNYPIEVEIKQGAGGLSQNSLALLNQIRAIDQQRLVKRLGKLQTEIMEKINKALVISLGLINL